MCPTIFLLEVVKKLLYSCLEVPKKLFATSLKLTKSLVKPSFLIILFHSLFDSNCNRYGHTNHGVVTSHYELRFFDMQKKFDQNRAFFLLHIFFAPNSRLVLNLPSLSGSKSC